MSSAPVRIDDDSAGTVRREPLGVVGIIVPWNWPNVLLYMRVAESLATGTPWCACPPHASLSSSSVGGRWPAHCLRCMNV